MKGLIFASLFALGGLWYAEYQLSTPNLKPQAEQTVESNEFTPIVKFTETRIEPTHGHLIAELAKCASDACAANFVANSGMTEVELAVAMYGDKQQVYKAQLEPGGPFVENPDLNGNGEWDMEDQIELDRLLATQ